jgi:hypothetical protein
MSCSAPTKLVSYYSNKINIYDNCAFIPLPEWNSCPPQPQIYITPVVVYPPIGPYSPPEIVPLPQPVNYPGAYCSPLCNNPNAPSGCGGVPSGVTPCGPCGR